MKLNKKGFTLVELLAVIAILAILVVIAVPAVLNLFNDAKEGTFVTQAQSIFKAAEQKYLTNQLDGGGNITFCSTGGNASSTATTSLLDLEGTSSIQYNIEFTNGKVVKFIVSDGTSRSINIATDPVDISDINKNAIETGEDTVTISACPYVE